MERDLKAERASTTKGKRTALRRVEEAEVGLLTREKQSTRLKSSWTISEEDPLLIFKHLLEVCKAIGILPVD